MVDVKEEVSLYEILIRVHPDGLWAAQYQTIKEIKIDGVTFGSPALGEVSPLNTEDSAAFAIVEQLMGSASAKSLVLYSQLREHILAQQLLIDELSDKLAALQSKGEPS